MTSHVLFGASGFLGQHVVRELRGRGLDLVCAGRRPVEDAEYRACDVREEAQVTALLDECAPGHILNCAALSRAADCFADPEAARRTNRDFPELLATWAAKHGARLVHVSTDMVFAGDAPEGGYLEDSIAEPVNEYGRSKRAGEEAVLAADSRALIVRLPLLFGDSMGRGLGASDSLLAAVQRGERPGLFTDEWRTPLDVGDAASALVELCESELSGLLHVAGPERVTRFELGELVLAANRLPLDSIRESTRDETGGSEPRPRDVSLNSERARAQVETELRGPRAFFAHED